MVVFGGHGDPGDEPAKVCMHITGCHLLLSQLQMLQVMRAPTTIELSYFPAFQHVKDSPCHFCATDAFTCTGSIVVHKRHLLKATGQ